MVSYLYKAGFFKICLISKYPRKVNTEQEMQMALSKFDSKIGEVLQHPAGAYIPLESYSGYLRIKQKYYCSFHLCVFFNRYKLLEQKHLLSYWA